MIVRMDTCWDHGFITDEQEYLRQRLELQQQLEQLTPVDNNDLERAVDLLDNFASYWEECGEDPELQAELINKIVERVYVRRRNSCCHDLAVKLSSGIGAQRK